MKRKTGFEPVTSRLEGEKLFAVSILKLGAVDGNRTRLSLIDSEVPYPESYHGILVSWTGIEPVLPTWKASVLTIKLPGYNLAGVLGIEPRLASSKPAVMSHYTTPQQ